jgi:G:T/U-mismatch repair DNA glycosylase
MAEQAQVERQKFAQNTLLMRLNASNVKGFMLRTSAKLSQCKRERQKQNSSQEQCYKRYDEYLFAAATKIKPIILRVLFTKKSCNFLATG